MQCTVRGANHGDIPAIAGLLGRLAREEGFSTPVDERTVRHILDRFAQSLVADAGGDVIGTALVYPGFDLDTATTGLHLEALVVDPAWRGRGVGRQLIAAAAAAAEAEGGAWVAWYARQGNRAARRFYRRLGAREERYLNLYLQDQPFADLAAQRRP